MRGSDLFQTGESTDFWINAVAPADVDSDGDLDLAVLGFHVEYNEGWEDVLVVFKNEGEAANGWRFSEERVALGDITPGASDLAWGDYDNDGDPDLALGSDGATVVYRNDGGTLTLLETAPTRLPGYYEDSSYTGTYDLRSLTWTDFDNDGDLDLLVPSVYDRDEFEFSTVLLRNDGALGEAWRFTLTESVIDPTIHAQSAWADEDGDGDVDLFLANVDPNEGTGYIKLFENVGGSFVVNDPLGLRVHYGLADWGDADADGDLDILVAGLIEEGEEEFSTVLRMYRNDGGSYAPVDLPVPDPEEPWLDLHAATWADYDSDGDIDLLATGSYVDQEMSEIVGRSIIYRNTGGNFAPLDVQLPAPVESVGRGGAFTWFDLDLDGDLDYLVAGAYFVEDGNGLVEAQINLYENGAVSANEPPAAASGLTAELENDGVALDWAPAVDDATRRKALTYDLEIRPAGEPFGRSRREPAPGGLGAVDDWKVMLPPGTYDWSVRAVDAAYNAGPRRKGRFTIEPATRGMTVTATPIDAPIRVPAGGGSFRYRVEVENTSSTWKPFELSVIVTKPDGSGRTVRKVVGSLAAGETFRRTLTQNVPAGYPSGRSAVNISLRPTPRPGTSDSFTWNKRP